jgi:hypothetical protein
MGLNVIYDSKEERLSIRIQPLVFLNPLSHSEDIGKEVVESD